VCNPSPDTTILTGFCSYRSLKRPCRATKAVANRCPHFASFTVNRKVATIQVFLLQKISQWPVVSVVRLATVESACVENVRGTRNTINDDKSCFLLQRERHRLRLTGMKDTFCRLFGWIHVVPTSLCKEIISSCPYAHVGGVCLLLVWEFLFHAENCKGHRAGPVKNRRTSLFLSTVLGPQRRRCRLIEWTWISRRGADSPRRGAPDAAGRTTVSPTRAASPTSVAPAASHAYARAACRPPAFRSAQFPHTYSACRLCCGWVWLALLFLPPLRRRPLPHRRCWTTPAPPPLLVCLSAALPFTFPPLSPPL